MAIIQLNGGGATKQEIFAPFIEKCDFTNLKAYDVGMFLYPNSQITFDNKYRKQLANDYYFVIVDPQNQGPMAERNLDLRASNQVLKSVYDGSLGYFAYLMVTHKETLEQMIFPVYLYGTDDPDFN